MLARATDRLRACERSGEAVGCDCRSYVRHVWTALASRTAAETAASTAAAFNFSFAASTRDADRTDSRLFKSSTDRIGRLPEGAESTFAIVRTVSSANFSARSSASDAARG